VVRFHASQCSRACVWLVGWLQRESFVKAVSSASIQLLLEWFTSTQMFEVFMVDQLAGRSHGLIVYINH